MPSGKTFELAVARAHFARVHGVIFRAEAKVHPAGAPRGSKRDSKRNLFRGVKFAPSDSTASPMERRFKAALELETGKVWLKVRPEWLRNPETGMP